MKLLELITKKRNSVCASVAQFNFNKGRMRVITDNKDVAKNSSGIVYWMSREQRVQDNWALLFAQKIAIEQNLPLHVCFCLVPKFLNATFRHYHFMIEGLKEIEQELQSLKIPFHLLIGTAKERIPDFVEGNKIGALVCDFSPLRISTKWLEDLRQKLNNKVPIYQVDAHNIVPMWIASGKLEYSPKTFRPKMKAKLDEFLTEYPPVVQHPVESSQPHVAINWEACYQSLQVDMKVGPVKWAKPGSIAAIETLEAFIEKGLPVYDLNRNNPNVQGQSNISPWMHYGHISGQRCTLEVNPYKSKYTSAVKLFFDQGIVRNELADNFCYFQNAYDSIDGADPWAYETLMKHASDKRAHIYTLEQFERAATHDALWNATQIQMMRDGKMQGFVRMYWAKKILEWSESPEKALEIAVYLNDKYELDGRDPRGYNGIMWSICGIHGLLSFFGWLFIKF